MDYPPLHKTRLGETFFAKRVPDLIKAIERLADGVEHLAREGRDPVVQELITHASDLASAAERVREAEIVPGSPQTREAFDTLRGSEAAVRRVLAKMG